MAAKRKIRKGGVFMAGLLLTFILIIALFHFLTPYVVGSENAAKEYFDSLNIEFNETVTTVNQVEIHTVKTGNPESRKAVLFLHGTPGSWMDFNSFLSDSILRSNFQLIAIDRPGHGLSDFDKSMMSIAEQGAVITKFIKEYNFDSIIVVGYSYGGPIAGILAVNDDFPISKLVLLSPANGPDCEPIFWFNKLLSITIIRSLFPRFVGVANDEKMRHAEELEAVLSIWSRIDIPAIHVHSVEDWIAPYSCNVSFSRDHLKVSQLEIISLAGEPHFLPSTKLEFVKELILK